MDPCEYFLCCRTRSLYLYQETPACVDDLEGKLTTLLAAVNRAMNRGDSDGLLARRLGAKMN